MKQNKWKNRQKRTRGTENLDKALKNGKNYWQELRAFIRKYLRWFTPTCCELLPVVTTLLGWAWLRVYYFLSERDRSMTLWTDYQELLKTIVLFQPQTYKIRKYCTDLRPISLWIYDPWLLPIDDRKWASRDYWTSWCPFYDSQEEFVRQRGRSGTIGNQVCDLFGRLSMELPLLLLGREDKVIAGRFMRQHEEKASDNDENQFKCLNTVCMIVHEYPSARL